VTVVMRAFQAGCSEVWEELVGRATGGSPAVVAAASVIWEWVHQVSTAAAEGHAAALATASAGRQVLRWQLVAAVLSGQRDDGQVAQWARQLDLDPDADFQVVCSPAVFWTDDEAHDLVTALDDGPVRAQAAVVGDLLCVVSQRPVPALMGALAAVSDHPDRVPAGIGLMRPGLEGARRSAMDAVHAMRLAQGRGEPVSWPDSWLWAELAAATERLAAVLTPDRELDLDRQGPLVETVRAFAQSRFSLAETARALTVHPNSVAYRLGRWRELTGWDPQTFDGLTCSLAHIELASQAAMQAAVDEQ
jgi:hypothetical protein